MMGTKYVSGSRQQRNSNRDDIGGTKHASGSRRQQKPKKENIGWQVGKLSAFLGRRSKIRHSHIAALKGKVQDDKHSSEERLLELLSVKRARKQHFHRKRLQAALKKARQLECRRLASRVKRLRAESNKDAVRLCTHPP